MNSIPEPNPNSPTWPIVLAFAKLMERKLALNRHKGDRDGWMKESASDLIDRTYDEFCELNDAVIDCEHNWMLRNGSPITVALEAADVANFAMMTADRVTNGTLFNARISERDNL